MDLKDKITDYCQSNVTLFGYADISKYKDEIVSEDLKQYNYAISLAIHIPDNIVDNLDSDEGRLKYLDAYVEINNKLDDISLYLENMIRKEGFDAKAVNASYILPDGRLVGSVSHKFVANLAGLGWIGKSCLLITPEYGPRLRWVTVLTNYKLPFNKKRMNSHCNTCDLCVSSCPVHAFSGVEFDECEPRDVRYDANLCNDYFAFLEKEGKPRLCGICVKVCPWGIKKRVI